MGKRISSWKVLGWALVATAVAAGLFLVWLEWETSRAWAELDRRSAQDVNDERARPVRRVFLRPGTQPGSPWDDYEDAAARARQVKKSDLVLLEKFLRFDDRDLRGEVLGILNCHPGVIQALAQGASRQDSGVPDFGACVEIGRRPSMSWISVLTLAFCDARSAFDRGDGIRGVGRIADIMQFVRDMQWTGLLPESSLYHHAMHLLREQVGHLLASGGLAPEAAADLERLLEEVDAASPSVEFAVRRELIYAVRRINTHPEEIVAEPDLRFLFSKRRKILSWVGWRRVGAAALRGSDLWSGAEYKARQAEFSGTGSGFSPDKFRNARGQLRVTRAALAWVRSGTVPTLEDPLGALILHRAELDGVTIWSLGSDLIDHGAGEGDIVLRLRR